MEEPEQWQQGEERSHCQSVVGQGGGRQRGSGINTLNPRCFPLAGPVRKPESQGGSRSDAVHRGQPPRAESLVRRAKNGS